MGKVCFHLQSDSQLYTELTLHYSEQSSGCLGDQPDIDHDHDHEESEDGHNHDSDEDSGASTFQGAPIMGTIMASAALLVACAW